MHKAGPVKPQTGWGAFTGWLGRYFSFFRGREVRVLKRPDKLQRQRATPYRERLALQQRDIKVPNHSKLKPGAGSSSVSGKRAAVTHRPRSAARPAAHSAGDRHSRTIALEQQTLKSFHDGKANLVIGDISDLKAILGHPLDALACHHITGSSTTTELYDELAAKEPSLKNPEFLSSLNHRTGQSTVTGAGKATSLGFRNLIHTPVQTAADAHLKTRLTAAYVSTIRAAADRNAPSLAIPVLGNIPGLSSKEVATIAQKAINYCLSDPEIAASLPRLFLVFPNSNSGRSQYKACKAQFSS